MHTPEFSFESVPSNVEHAVKQLDVTWPVALDPRYATWKAYRNEYWPADYLIDRQGHLRDEHFGEGAYAATEVKIRELLGARGPDAAQLADMAPTELVTPESYLGYVRLDPSRYAGSTIVPGSWKDYRLPSRLLQDELAYGGSWRVGSEYATAGKAARLALHFHAKDVYIVLGGRGRIGVTVGGLRLRPLRVGGISRLYTVVASPHLLDTALLLRFSPGIRAYSFTFG